MRLKKDKISLFPPKLKKVDISFGSVCDETFANIFAWFPTVMKKVEVSFGSLSDTTFANILE